MQMVKIQIPDRNDCARGFAALIRRGCIECFKDNVFIVPEPALAVLQDMAISYLESSRGSSIMLRER